MAVQKDLLYSSDHEWVRVEGSKAYIGITDYAQHALGSIVYVEFPEIGDELKTGDACGVIESVKAASDSFLPISGKVVEVNGKLEDEPESLNDDPYGNWILCVEVTNEEDLKNLMSEKEYEAFIAKEE
jgi:glycine cleavage system H protein